MPLLLLADQFKVTGIVLFWIGEATVSFDGVAMLWTGAPGAAGTVAGGAVGVTLLEGAEAGLVPTALVAVTVKVKAVPLVRPVTVAVVGGAPPPAGALTVAEPPAGLEVTV